MGDSIIGRNNDGTLNEDYSKWCYADGTYTYHNMDELLDICVKNMVNENFTKEQAHSYMKKHKKKLLAITIVATVYFLILELLF